MVYYKYHRKMAAPHHVCADVSANEPAAQMTYNIHHIKMGAPHYEYADVSSNYFSY